MRYSCRCSPWHGCGTRAHGASLWGQPLTQPWDSSPTCSSRPFRFGTGPSAGDGEVPIDLGWWSYWPLWMKPSRHWGMDTQRWFLVCLCGCTIPARFPCFRIVLRQWDFFCLDIITACVVVVKSLFSYIKKTKIPKSQWTVVRLIQGCVARFQSIKKKSEVQRTEPPFISA